MAVECPTKPDLHAYLTGNALYDVETYPFGDFSWPTQSSADNWRLIGHPLSAKAGELLESRATACAAGASLFDGVPIGGSEQVCGSSVHSWGIQQAPAQAAWEDYKSRVEAFYNAYYNWLDTSDPSFVSRLECYNNQDLVSIFGMLEDFAGLKGKLSTEEMSLLQQIADASVCPYLQEAAAAAVYAESSEILASYEKPRDEYLDSYIRAINALDAAGPVGHGLYAWLVAPHLEDSRVCVLALFEYDEVLTAAGKPLPESSAAELQAAEPPAGIIGLEPYVIAAKSKKVATRLRTENAAAPQSMAPPPEEEGAEVSAEIDGLVDQYAQDNADLTESLVKAGEEEYARFLEQCAANQDGPEHSEMLKWWEGGQRAYCPPLEVAPPPEEKRRNLALLLGVGGLLVGGPVGGIAGGALGAYLDNMTNKAPGGGL